MRHENLEGGAPAPPIEDGPVSHELALPVADLTATLTATEPANAMASSSASPAPNAEATARAAISVDLNELQMLTPEQFEERCREFDLRIHPGRTRHHQILDLVRYLLGCGARVTAEGFLELQNESVATLRWPRLNFLPVPEDVGVSRGDRATFSSSRGTTFGGNPEIATRSREIIDAG